MYNLLIKILKKIFKNKGLFDIKIKEQHKIINEFSKPKDYIERSYFQYKSQIALENKFKFILLNLFSFLILIVIIPFFLLKKEKININLKKNAVNFGYKERLPESVINEYKIIDGINKFKLDIKDIKFIFNKLILRYLFSPYFILKNIFKIAIYRYNFLKNPNVKVILTNSEYSFTSSVLTKFCNENKILHINYMHGDKLYYIRDSFFRFDKCYVWDQHYINLFKKLKAKEDHFIIELPMTFIKKYKNIEEKSKKTNIVTYYLQGFETEKELKKIQETLKILSKQNKLVRVRPHPRYGKKELIYKYFYIFEVEEKKDILLSLKEAEYIISKYSTVLYEGYLMKKNVIIDDVSNIKFYKKIEEMDYIMTKKNIEKLSGMINNE